MSEYLFRRNVVLEALRSKRRTIHHLWVQRGARQLSEIVDIANAEGIKIDTISKERVSQMAKDSSHQGVLLEVGPYPYVTLDEILDPANLKGELPFLLLLDLLHGPQNIGTLMRTAEACGVHGVIFQDRRAPEITPSVVQYSAGSVEHLLITQVTNLSNTIGQLKNANIWVVGLDLIEDSQYLGQIDLNIPIAVVIGHEGQGLRRRVRESCDFLLKLPMRGKVDSLNAASAGAIILYAAWQARGFIGSK